MKLTKICSGISLAAVLLLTLSCSNSEDSDDKGIIKETQDKIAQKGLDYIQVPLDATNEASRLINEHNSQIEGAEGAPAQD